MAEDVRLAVGAEQFSHVGEGCDDLGSLVDVTILADTVLLLQESIIDVYVLCVTLLVHEGCKVLIRNLVLLHVLVGEMHHHAG